MILKKTLKVCIQHYLNTRKVVMLEDYLDTMPRDEKGKKELLDAIDSYDIPILYHTLFEDFAKLLTDEELLRYAKKGIDTFEDEYLLNLINDVFEDAIERKREELEKNIDDSNCLDEDKMVFTVQNDKGEEVECEVLFTFENEETGKEYVVYTDGSLDEEENTKVFASILKEIDGEMRLLPIETEEEWAVVESILEELNKD